MSRYSMKKLLSGDTIFNAANYILCTMIALLCIYPFYYVFIYSISDSTLASSTTLFLFPVGLTLENYIRVLKVDNITNAAFISISRTLIGTVYTVFISALFAYLVTKKRLFARSLVFRMLIFTMYFNPGIIPYYVLFKQLNLTNNFLVYIIPFALSGYYVILVKTYIEQLPASIEESAFIDGAGYFTVFTRIILPMSAPIIATITVFSAVYWWNSWFDNLMYANTKKLQTLQLLLLNTLRESQAISSSQIANMQASGGKAYAITPTSIRMTITMLVTLPIIFVYPFLQKHFAKGIMMGAIKG